MADATTQAPAAAPGTPAHDAAMVAKVDAAHAAIAGTTPPVQAPVAEPAKVEGLPEKFKSVADMATAYAELEKKLGQQGTPPAKETDPPKEGADKLAIPTDQKAAEEATAKAGVDFAALTTEFEKDGKLSEDTYKKLEAGGIPKEMVDGYIAGQQALATQAAAAYDNAAFEQAGGQDKYSAMVKWAAQGGIKADKAAEFNEAVSSGDKTRMQLAVANLKGAFEAANGVAPNFIQSGAAASDGAYESMSQVTADMKKPEYKTDPAFRAKVERKLAASTTLFSVQERS